MIDYDSGKNSSVVICVIMKLHPNPIVLLGSRGRMQEIKNLCSVKFEKDLISVVLKVRNVQSCSIEIIIFKPLPKRIRDTHIFHGICNLFTNLLLCD